MMSPNALLKISKMEIKPRVNGFVKINPFDRFKWLHIFWPGVEVIANVPSHLAGVVEFKVWIAAYHFIE